MREFLGAWIAEQAQADPMFTVLSGDHGYALFDPIRKVRPEQFVNVGVMEQAMVGIAAGLAKTGYKPWVYGLSAFVPIRVLEQIKLDVCYSKLPVVFLGDGAGLVYSTLGASHQAGEDLACLRALANITIFSPSDASELKPVLEEALRLKSPCYIRIGKGDLPVLQSQPRLTTESYFTHAEPAQNLVLVSHGSMGWITQKLASENALPSYSIPKIHPISENTLKVLEKYSNILCLEEHSRIGGLTSALMDAFSNSRFEMPKIRCFALKDQFSERCGSHQYAMSEHQLSDSDLRRRLSQFLKDGI